MHEEATAAKLAPSRPRDDSRCRGATDRAGLWLALAPLGRLRPCTGGRTSCQVADPKDDR
jgi:hypothetical protein